MWFLRRSLLFTFFAVVLCNLLLVLFILIPLDGVFVVLDGGARDNFAGGGTGMEPVYFTQKPVTTSTLLVSCHVTFHPVT